MTTETLKLTETERRFYRLGGEKDPSIEIESLGNYCNVDNFLFVIVSAAGRRLADGRIIAYRGELRRMDFHSTVPPKAQAECRKIAEQVVAATWGV
jgi:hypothetical protein